LTKQKIINLKSPRNFDKKEIAKTEDKNKDADGYKRDYEKDEVKDQVTTQQKLMTSNPTGPLQLPEGLPRSRIIESAGCKYIPGPCDGCQQCWFAFCKGL
jgi:hypothetical protein